MNGFEQIKSFYSWVFNNSDKVRPTHISLYLFLLNQNNRSMWVEWFKCPFDLAMQGACIGNKNTYYKCLDELQMFGLIVYKKGVNNYKAPLIKLVKMYDSEPLTEQVTVPQSEPLTEPLTELLNKNIYKLITSKYKTINLKEKEVVVFIKSLEETKTETEKKYKSFAHLSITFDEVEKLKENYTISQIDGVLDSIENYRLNKNYVSLYLTAKKWLEKEYPNVKNNPHPNGIGKTNQKLMTYDD